MAGTMVVPGAVGPAPVVGEADDPRRGLVDYYSAAGPDYRYWSAGFNMHFGYFDLRATGLRLEPMLERMNREVWRRLEIDPSGSCRLLDLGCGLGATARHIAAVRPRCRSRASRSCPGRSSRAGGCVVRPAWTAA